MIDKALKATTQEHLDVHNIKEHLVILKDGSAAMILQTSAINFGLLSEEEQDAAIYGYANLLNSLSFTTQILLRSVRKDITDYLEFIDEQVQQTKSQKIKEQVVKYRAFIKSLVKENRVLEKKFYVVIPYSTFEMGIPTSSFNPLAKAPQKPPYDDEFIINKAKLTLYPRRDHLIRQLARIGIQARQLSTQELVTLFYRIYNPNQTDLQHLTLPEDYETTAVQTTDTKPRGVVTSTETPPTPPVPVPDLSPTSLMPPPTAPTPAPATTPETSAPQSSLPTAPVPPYTPSTIPTAAVPTSLATTQTSPISRPPF